MRGVKMGGGEECVIVDIIDNIEGFGEDEKIYRFFSEYWSDEIDQQDKLRHHLSNMD